MAADDERVREGLRNEKAVPWFGTLAELSALANELGLDSNRLSVHGTVIPVPLALTGNRIGSRQ